jgi:lipopolysaccharide export LptBFGC system permease protein LptF
LKNASPGEAQRTSAKKNTQKKTIEKCNSERSKHEKWRKSANQTRDQLDKHDFGKKLQNPREKQTKCQKKTRKMQQKCKKMQIRPGTKLDKRGKNAKPIIGKMQEKYELRFYTCIFLAFVILHFLHCVFALAFVLYF